MNKQPSVRAESLSFDTIYGELHECFGQVKDYRRHNTKYSMQDMLSAAFAMFSLKSPSLLDFSLRSVQEDTNLMEVYKIEKLCSDTQMREVLDQVSTDEVRNLFKKVLERVQKSDFFASYHYWKELVVVSVDGVEHFLLRRCIASIVLRKNINPEK